MNRPSHKTEGVNHTKTMWFYPFVFTGEERNEETCYGYCNEYQPHAVKRMFDYKNGMLYDMRWDEEKSSGLFDSVAENKSAGNLGQVSIAKPGEMFERGRFLFWTEDSRMHAAIDEKFYSYYTYDHSGGSCASREQSQACLSYAEMEQRRRSQRRLKLTGDNKLLDVNADFMATYTILNEPTLYPSAYMVLTDKGYTNVAKVESRASSLALPRRSSVTGRKHYYAGTERVAARLGGGGLDALNRTVVDDVAIRKKADALFDQSLEQVNNRILYENDLDCIMQNEFSKEEFGYWIDDIPHQMKAEVEIDHGQFKDMVNSMLDDINRGQEKEVYFYHSDLCKSREQSQAGLSYAETQQSVRSKHLGSAAYLTNDAGQVTQTLNYLPYGEDWVDIQNHVETRYPRLGIYTYNGKEKDYESGFHYYGARYYWSEVLTGWLSVDPMMDKYPSISPYAYCAWNPVKLIDPDGKEAAPPDRWTRIDPVISNKMFVGWDTEINNCFKLAQKQMGKKGVKGEYVKYKIYDEKKGANKKNTEKAVSYINQILEAGNPVMVGVDDQDGFAKSNGDESTDHWIVIVGRGNDNKGNYFLFYDNATGCGESGASDNNRLYYDADSGEIKGRADEKRNRYAAKRRDYIITQVMATTGVKKEEKKKGTNND